MQCHNQESTMFKIGLVLAVYGALAACATTQANTAQAQECESEIEESTGSRVEANTVCRPTTETD
jgi:hypothetical protein